MQYQHTLMGRDGLLTVFIVVVTLGGPAALGDQSKPAPATLEGPWRKRWSGICITYDVGAAIRSRGSTDDEIQDWRYSGPVDRVAADDTAASLARRRMRAEARAFVS